MAVAIRTTRWTLAELHRLPNDGNKYELIGGELLVTPPPTDEHETIAARLARLLDPFVATHGLGFVYRPRAVLRHGGSEVEPDLMVRLPHPDPRGSDSDWSRAPIPILVIEILSDYTRRRDRNEKQQFYADAGVAEYWIVDPEQREVTVARLGQADRTLADVLQWSPSGATESLSISVPGIFAASG